MEQKTSNQRGTFNLMCYLKKSKALKNGEIPVYLRATVNKQAFTFSMQGSVLPSLWSQEKEKSKGKDKKAQELNHYIESVKSRLYKIHRELEIDGKTISAQIIKDIFLGNVTTSLQMSIDELCYYPVIFPIKKPERISSNFGVRYHPIYRVRKFHAGIDISGTKGILVYATGNGIIVRKGYCWGYGNFIKIKHASGFRSFYAHLSRTMVNVGDSGERGLKPLSPILLNICLRKFML